MKVSNQASMKSKAFKDYLIDAKRIHRIRKQASNIGILGDYGTGKSSLIDTYVDKYYKFGKKRKIARISFGNLPKIIADNDNSLNEYIEKNVLQQIFFLAKSKQTPHSTINRVPNTRVLSAFGYFFLCVVTILMVGIYFLMGYLSEGLFRDFLLPIYYENNEFFLNPDIFSDGKIEWNYLIKIGIYSNVFIILILFLNDVFNRKIFKTIKYKDIEILSDNKSGFDKSLVDAFMGELLYFFKKTQYEIVVFEDIDRITQSNYIFKKLNEINYIINNSTVVKKHITFIYAAKLSTISEIENRSKFFDYVIILNSRVTKSRMISELYKMKLEKNRKFEPDFSYSMIESIPDMRSFIMIKNDFLSLCDEKSDDISFEKKWVMSQYKNLLPNDFQASFKSKGIIYNILNQRNIIQNHIVESKNEIINKYKHTKQEIEKGINLSEHDIKTLLEKRIETTNSSYSKVRITSNINDEPIKFTYYTGSYGDYQGEISRKSITNGTELLERLNSLKYVKELEKNDTESSIKLIENQVNLIKNNNINNLFKNITFKEFENLFLKYAIKKKENNEETILEEYNDKNLRFIFNCIKQAYITENFLEEMNYSNEYLSNDDITFLNKIKTASDVDSTYKIQNFDLLINSLKPYMLEPSNSLNTSLFDFLHRNKVKYKEYYENYMTALNFLKEDEMDFIDNLLSNIPNVSEVLNEIVANNKLILNHLLTQKTDTNLYNIIDNLNLDSMIKDDIDLIKTRLEESSNIIEVLNKINSSRVEGFLMKINPQLTHISSTESPHKKFIFLNGFFKINKVNLNELSKFLTSAEISNRYNIMTNVENKYVDLFKYLESNLKEYVQVILSDSDGMITENDKILNTMIELQKNDNDKNKIIDKVFNHSIKHVGIFSKKIIQELNNRDKISLSIRTLSDILELNDPEIVDQYIQKINSYTEKFEYDVEKLDNQKIITTILNETKLDNYEFIKDNANLDNIIGLTNFSYIEYLVEKDHKFSNKEIEFIVDKHLVEISNKNYALVEEVSKFILSKEDITEFISNEKLNINLKVKLLINSNESNLVDWQKIDVETKFQLAKHNDFSEISFTAIQSINSTLNQKESIHLLRLIANNLDYDEIEALVSLLGKEYVQLRTLYMTKELFPSDLIRILVDKQYLIERKNTIKRKTKY